MDRKNAQLARVLGSNDGGVASRSNEAETSSRRRKSGTRAADRSTRHELQILWPAAHLVPGAITNRRADLAFAESLVDDDLLLTPRSSALPASCWPRARCNIMSTRTIVEFDSRISTWRYIAAFTAVFGGTNSTTRPRAPNVRGGGSGGSWAIGLSRTLAQYRCGAGLAEFGIGPAKALPFGLHGGSAHVQTTKESKVDRQNFFVGR